MDPMSKSPQILIVEDEWIVSRAVQKTLEAAGYTVTDVVASAKEALQSIERRRPDLVLIDIVLQNGVDGVELARQIRSQIAVPVIYVTAYADTKTLARAAETEPAGYIVKPFQESQLLSAVVMALNRTAPPERPWGAGEASAVAGGAEGSTGDPRQQHFRTVARALADRAGFGGREQMALTSRELEVVRLLLSNGRVVSIAERLSVSPHTVRNHLRSVFRKLGVHSQVELIRELSSHMNEPAVSAGSRF